MIHFFKNSRNPFWGANMPPPPPYPIFRNGDSHHKLSSAIVRTCHVVTLFKNLAEKCKFWESLVTTDGHDLIHKPACKAWPKKVGQLMILKNYLNMMVYVTRNTSMYINLKIFSIGFQKKMTLNFLQVIQ